MDIKIEQSEDKSRETAAMEEKICDVEFIKANLELCKRIKKFLDKNIIKVEDEQLEIELNKECELYNGETIEEKIKRSFCKKEWILCNRKWSKFSKSHRDCILGEHCSFAWTDDMDCRGVYRLKGTKNIILCGLDLDDKYYTKRESILLETGQIVNCYLVYDYFIEIFKKMMKNSS